MKLFHSVQGVTGLWMGVLPFIYDTKLHLNWHTVPFFPCMNSKKVWVCVGCSFSVGLKWIWGKKKQKNTIHSCSCKNRNMPVSCRESHKVSFYLFKLPLSLTITIYPELSSQIINYIQEVLSYHSNFNITALVAHYF